jgi:hypothetical protein
MEYYHVEIPREVQPSLILAVENEDLGIAGGLQDRVIQVYEGLVYMDFDPAREQIIDGYKTYAYEPLDPALLPPLYVAYSAALSEPTEIFHNDIRGRYNRGEAQVVNAMKHFAEIAYQGRAAILQRDGSGWRNSSTKISIRGEVFITSHRGKCRWSRPRARAAPARNLPAPAARSSAPTAMRQCLRRCARE